MFQRTLLIILFVIGSVGNADEVENLYQSLVAVDDQSAESRERGIQLALSKVLIKLTGNQEMVLSPLVTSSLDDAVSYVDALSFQDLSTLKDGLMERQLGLRVEFSKSAVDQLIRSLRLPVLPANRPKFLFWIIKDDTSLGRRYLGEEIGDPDMQKISDDMLDTLDRIMADRGIPYMLPTFDLEDQLVLPVDAAWSLNREKIDFASRRYNADGWIALRFYRNSFGDVRGTWTYQTQGSPTSVDFSFQANLDWFSSEINQLTDGLTSSFSYLPQAIENRVLIEISGVNSLNDYRQVFQQIEKLEVVNSFDLFSVHGSQMRLAVSAEGGPELLQQALLRSGFFQVQLLELTVDTENLYVSWTPP